MNGERILILEDNLVTLKALTSYMIKAGYEVCAVTNTADALHVIQRSKPDLVILDLTLLAEDPFNGLNDGFCFKKWIQYMFPGWDFPVVIYTSSNSEHLYERALTHGIPWIVKKGVKPSVLLDTVREALEDHQAQNASRS